MEGQKFFNKKQLNFQFKLINFFKNRFFGIKKHTIQKFEERLEVTDNNYLTDYKNNKWIILNNILYSMVPKNRFMQRRTLINIYFLDFINSYRGYRHSFGLPVNGQRTWTNAKTVFSSNCLLRNYKLNSFKKSLLNLPLNDINNAFYLEQLNFLWKSQWELEWFFAKKKRLIDLKKSRGYIKFDVNTLSKINPNVKDKKKQSLFSIGFDPGFTKFILKNNIKLKN